MATNKNQPKSLQEIAKSYYDSGLNLIPITTDGERVPKVSWGQYRTGGYSWFHSRHWWHEFYNSGIAIMCGPTSGNLEVIDFDQFHIFPLWEGAVGGVDDLPVVETPRGGRHVYYRCAVIGPSETLALDANEKTLVEIKGDGGPGGLITAPGSPLGTHWSGRPYRLLHGDLCSIPKISPERREKFITVGRNFNQFVKPEKVRTAPRPRISPEQEQLLDDLFGMRVKHVERPGDRFNQEASWEEILEPHGFTFLRLAGEVGLWCKPGSTKHHQLTTNAGGSDRLYCFSPSASPFMQGESYDKFAAFALLNFGGDFSAAAKHLQGVR